jgi:hypothetical protein
LVCGFAVLGAASVGIFYAPAALVIVAATTATLVEGSREDGTLQRWIACLVVVFPVVLFVVALHNYDL